MKNVSFMLFGMVLCFFVATGCATYSLVPGIAVTLSDTPPGLDLNLRPCDAYDVVNIGGKLGDGLALVGVALCPEVSTGS